MTRRDVGCTVGGDRTVGGVVSAGQRSRTDISLNETHEKVLNIISQGETRIKTTMRSHCTPTRTAGIDKTDKCCVGGGVQKSELPGGIRSVEYGLAVPPTVKPRVTM